MGFDDFIALTDSLIRPYGAQLLPEEVAPDRRVWKAPKDEMAAVLTYQPEDADYPVRLDFSVYDEQGTQTPLLFKLDDDGARSAAIQTLDYFGIDYDLNVTDDDTG